MGNPWEWLFWASVGLCLYVYAGYLLLLVALDGAASLRSNARYLAGGGDRRRGEAEGPLPRVSVLIAAHNEEAVIRAKLENTLGLDYPRDRLEILVGSDGSTDRTDALVSEFAGHGVRLSSGARAGKASVLNRLATLATGEYWLFTDANTVVDRGAVRRLLRRCREPGVGGVCGRLRLVAPSGAPLEEGAYWRYENLLKFYESRLGALMGANGGLYMLRREAWRPLPPQTIVDDFLATMRILLDGWRLVYEPEAVAVEETAADAPGEFRRRARIAAGNFQSLRELRPLLWRPSFAGFALWSHKVLRWSVPLVLPLMLLANLALALQGHGFYLLLLGGQVAFYLAAVAGRVVEVPPRLRRITAIPRYFVDMNAALLVGLGRYLRGSQAAIWQRTARAAGGRTS